MTNKEINRVSGRSFENLLLPSWAFRPQEDQEDYGIDGEIEITTAEDKATGFIFKVQLKGTSFANYDQSGQLVFSEASVDHFEYYINRVSIPMIFVVCDISNGNCYWARVQGNRQIESAYRIAREKGQKTFTVKFPGNRIVQKSAESADQIIEAVEGASQSITLRRLQGISPEVFRQHITHDASADSAEKQLRLFAGVAANVSVSKMIRSGDYDAAEEKAMGLFENNSEAPGNRILGGISLVLAYKLIERRKKSPSASFDGAKFKLGVSSRMLEVCRQLDCENRTKRYVRIYARAARMNINARGAMALAVSEKAQSLQGETISGPITRIHRMDISAKVSRDFFRLRDSMYRLGTGGFYSVMPYALSEITESIIPFVSSLRTLDRGDLADAYVDALFEFLPFCIGVVRRFKDSEEVADILNSLGMRFVGLANVSTATSMRTLLERYENALMGEPQFNCLDKVLAELRELVDGFESRSQSREKPSLDQLRAYYAQQAADLGIDLNDPKDSFADIIRIGLIDLDPTRVATNCQHLHVITTSYGMPAEMLGLPTAGSKRIICLKHGHSSEGLKLDDVFKHFSRKMPWNTEGVRCEDCSDKCPHVDGWKWTEAWQKEQARKYDALRVQQKKSDE